MLARAGDKIELVGQIVSVKQGIGKRGRGRGRPYVFLNFGVWNKESVKITIWSEGLGNMSTRPTDAWVGKWISVTGLVEPPYEGKHYGKTYRNVGVTVTADNQIIHMSELEAKFRLGRGGAQPSPRAANDSGKPTNAEILSALRGGEARAGSPIGGSTTRTRPTPAAPTPKTRNEQILKGLQTGSTQAQGRGQRYSPPPSQVSSPSLFSRIPAWVWIGGCDLAFRTVFTREVRCAEFDRRADEWQSDGPPWCFSSHIARCTGSMLVPRAQQAESPQRTVTATHYEGNVDRNGERICRMLGQIAH